MSELLILTNSTDQTVDLLLQYMPVQRERIFRFNFDLFQHYQFTLTPTDFRIVDPLNRVCSLQDVKKAYLRKAMRREGVTDEAYYRQEELWYGFRALLHMLWEADRIVLVEPFAELSRLDKLTQLKVASAYFPVPPTQFVQNAEMPDNEQSVIKSLTGTPIGRRGVYTSVQNPQQLSPAFPWYVQDYIPADYDLTVVYVRGKIFPFRLSRVFLEQGVDWRQDAENFEHWEFVALDAPFNDQIRAYMRALKLDYGRLDFLWQEGETPIFLEVNPNGQYGWLDLKNTTGLFSAIAEMVSPDTPVYPIPFSPFR